MANTLVQKRLTRLCGDNDFLQLALNGFFDKGLHRDLSRAFVVWKTFANICRH